MAKIIFFLGVVCSFILTAMGCARLKLESYSGDVDGRDQAHPCPTLNVRFDQNSVPSPVRDCACPEQAKATTPNTAVHPPRALVDAAAPGDRVRLSWHEYASMFGGDVRTAATWELLRNATGKETYVAKPAGSIYTSIIITSLAPLLVGTVLAVVVGLFFQPKSATGA